MNNAQAQPPTLSKYTLSNTNLLESASFTAPIRAVIPAHTLVQVVDSAEDWYLVTYDTQTGYISTSSLSTTKYTWLDVLLRSYPSAESNPLAPLPPKSEVEVLSISGAWSLVMYKSLKGYIFNYFLTDDGNPPAKYNYTYFRTDMTRFVNENNIQSPTVNLITTDLENKITYVFEKANNGSWVLLYHWSCTIGKPSTPTIQGTFYVSGRKPYFGTDSYRAKYATRIKGGYYYHTVLFNAAGTEVIDMRLGVAISHGCIRLAVENAQWIYDNVLDASAIVIH